MPQKPNQPLALIADIGGTNARFALVDETLSYYQAQNLTVADYPTLTAAINAYLHALEQSCPPIVGLAVACPADLDRVTLTNSHWHFTKTKLQKELGCSSLLVINDFTALAYGVPKLAEDELHKIGGGRRRARANMVVLGPGTGFGVAGLLYQHQIGWIPTTGEGGHTEWAALDQLERQVQDLLLRDYQRLSIERVLQGKGLLILYKALCTIKGETPATGEIARITELGLGDSNATCRETLTLYCNMLGSVAGDMALAFGARGGVYIGGGITPRLLKILAYSNFRQRFENKGRMRPYNRAIPCFVITAPLRALDGLITAMQGRGLFIDTD